MNATRYLSPEPLLQDPKWVASQLRRGRQVPAYSYALNNPIANTDPNGLEVRFASNSPRSRAAYDAWKASGKFDYIWKSLEKDKKVVFELSDRPGLGGAGNAETYFSGCGPDGRPVVKMDFYWRSIDATRRSNPSISEAGIVLHEAVHGQGHLGDGHAWWEQSYGRDPAVTNSVEHAAEYYQDLFDGTPGRNWFTP